MNSDYRRGYPKVNCGLSKSFRNDLVGKIYLNCEAIKKRNFSLKNLMRFYPPRFKQFESGGADETRTRDLLRDRQAF